MTPIWLLVLYHFIFLIQSTFSWDKPLVFNPYNLEPYDVGDTSMTYRGGPYAVACPATNRQEQDFNKSFSLNNKSLFLRHFSPDRIDEMYGKRCLQNVELAAVYHNEPITKRQYLKFGYEVYFDKSKYQENFNQRLSYFTFEKVSKPVTEIIGNYFSSRSPQTPMLTELSENGTKNLKEMGFMWISKATLTFNESNWQADNLSYSIHKKVDPPAEKCDDYELLNKFYGRKTLDYFYSPDHQGEIFESIELPKDCESEDNCFMKYSLVPAYQFQTSKKVSCTNLTTVPVWSEKIAPLLDHLDKFLFAIAQVVDKKLTIYPSAKDILELSTIYNDGRDYGDEPKSRLMYLYPKKEKIAIPKVILKLVEYQTHGCDETDTLCWFQTFIVIHNEDEMSEKLCEDKCKVWGWESIQYPDKNNPEEKSDHIYCCEMDKKLRKILKGSSTDQFIQESLTLNRFPYFSGETYELEYEDKRSQIMDKMNQLFGDGQSSDPANSWTPLPSLDGVEISYL